MSTTEYCQPTHREELERVLLSGASAQIAHEPDKAAAIAKGIKTVLDELAPKMASGIVIPLIGSPSAGTTAASLSFPVIERPDTLVLHVPDRSPDSLEREIQAKASEGPRVTPFEVEAHIRSEFYFTAEQGVLGESEMGTRPASWTNLDQVTICVLILTNGTKIVGVNEGPVSRENFKADLGRQYARQKAVDQIWPLLGFRLRDELARPVLTEADALADLAGEPRPS